MAGRSIRSRPMGRYLGTLGVVLALAGCGSQVINAGSSINGGVISISDTGHYDYHVHVRDCLGAFINRTANADAQVYSLNIGQDTGNVYLIAGDWTAECD